MWHLKQSSGIMLGGHDLSVSLWLTAPLKGNVIN